MGLAYLKYLIFTSCFQKPLVGRHPVSEKQEWWESEGRELGKGMGKGSAVAGMGNHQEYHCQKTTPWITQDQIGKCFLKAYYSSIWHQYLK